MALNYKKVIVIQTSIIQRYNLNTEHYCVRDHVHQIRNFIYKASKLFALSLRMIAHLIVLNIQTHCKVQKLTMKKPAKSNPRIRPRNPHTKKASKRCTFMINVVIGGCTLNIEKTRVNTKTRE